MALYADIAGHIAQFVADEDKPAWVGVSRATWSIRRFIQWGSRTDMIPPYGHVDTLIVTCKMISCGIEMKHTPEGIARYIVLDKSPISLPAGPTQVVISDDFNHPLVVAPGTKTIKFGRKYNKPVSFPENVEIISFGRDYNQPTTFREGVKHVMFKYKYNQIFNIPDSLETIDLSENFWSVMHIPPNVAVTWVNRISSFFDDDLDTEYEMNAWWWVNLIHIPGDIQLEIII